MQKIILSLALASSIFVFDATQAQDSTANHQTMPLRLLDVSNPLQIQSLEEAPISRQPVSTENLDNFQKDIIRRVADIYQLHISGLEAQLEDDWISAESFITDAVNSSQALLDDYPEIRTDRRFVELSRAVITEYRQFYGITEPLNQSEGEIFAIHEELLENENELFNVEFEFPRDVNLNRTDVPLVQNRFVTNSLVYYTLRRPEVMELWLTRAEVYQPMMRQIFKEVGTPEELTYLAFIESGLNPTARSWASAVGMWQFIAATGRVYGLEVNWWIDERKDPEKSTRAAARHLKDLYNIWGDWHLAMANYNISPRGLKRAIDRAGGVKDYWQAYPYLPRETRGYVPGFIATTMIGMNPVEFGFQSKYEGTPYSYDVVEVDGLMPLDELAKAAGVSTEVIKDYNPELLRWATPPGNKYPLKVPTTVKKEDFFAAYAKIPKENRAENITMHTVRSGESIGLIARKYGTTVKGIFATNENISTTIYPGQKIIIPLPRGSATPIAVNTPTNNTNVNSTVRRTTTTSNIPANSTKLVYTVKTGDTIGHIAEWFDVRAYELRTWNGTGNTIRLNQKMTVYVPNNRKSHYEKLESLSFADKERIESRQKRGENIFLASTSGASSAKTYTVKRNDTLSEIAERHGLGLSKLRSLNNISGASIYVGQVLKVAE